MAHLCKGPSDAGDTPGVSLGRAGSDLDVGLERQDLGPPQLVLFDPVSEWGWADG